MSPLIVGKSMTGLIIDGIEGTPWTVATLSYDVMGGVLVEVPFVSHQSTPQFSAANGWFRGEEHPPNLAVVTSSGTYTLIGCQYSRAVSHESSGLSIGRIYPELTVSSLREGELHPPLKIGRLRSRLDGLQEVTDATSFDTVSARDEDTGRSQITISFPESASLTWRQGDAHLSIGPDSVWESEHRKFQISDRIFLTSTFDEPATFDSHLAEQTKVSALLTLLHGAPAYFRQHEVKDDQFPEKYISGKTAYVPYQDLISRKTHRDFQQSQPHKHLYKYSLASLHEIGPTGLETWASTHEEWKRVIEPLSALFRRRTTFEDALISTCIALEAAGHLLGPVEGEAETYSRRGKPTTATYLFRCLAQVPADWTHIAESLCGFSRAAANLYNDIKHFDRQAVPDPTHLMLTTQLLKLAARIVVLTQIDQSRIFTAKAAAGSEMSNALRAYKERGLFVSDAGSLIQGSGQLEDTE